MHFHYIAVTPDNKRVSGSCEATTVKEAARNLRHQGYTIIFVRKAPGLSTAWRFLNQDISLRSPLTAAELAYLTEEWAGLAQAGISVEDSLGFLASSAKPRVRTILAQIRDRIKAGTSLHLSLADHPKCFPATYISLIQSGETAGNLASTLRRLADDMSGKRELTADIRNALLYPAFLLLTSIIGITVLLTIVVPNLEEMFLAQGTQSLPLTTRLVIASSHALRDYGLIFTGGILAPFILVLALANTRRGRIPLDSLLLKLPQIGQLVRITEAARLSRSLGSLLKGSVPLSAALPLAIQTMSNRALRHALEQAHQKILTGSGIGDAIDSSGALPEEANGLIRMGERTGQLDTALERAAGLFEARAARRLKILTTMLTPALTIGFGLLAGIIMYAMLSTILSVNDLASQP